MILQILVVLACVLGSGHIDNVLAKNPPDTVVNSGLYNEKFFEENDLLGYVPYKNYKANALKTLNGKKLYDVVYNTDEHGRRVTPAENAGERPDCLLCFGCSFMFGQGVGQDETFPYYLGALLKNYRPYNYGVPGYGPQSMLAQLESDGMRAEVKGKHALLVYFYIDSHISRANGSMILVSIWGPNMPYYEINSRGELERKGSFLTGRPITTKFYRYMAGSWLGKYIFKKRDFPPVSDGARELTVKILEESFKTFKQKFNSGDFYVVYYSGATELRRYSGKLASAGIKVLDYSRSKELKGEGLRFPIDGHPTARAYKILAAMVARDIKASINAEKTR